VWGTGEHSVEEFLSILDWMLKIDRRGVGVRLFAGLNNPLKELSEALPIFKRIYLDDATKLRDTIVVEVCSGRRAPIALLSALFIKRARGWAIEKAGFDEIATEIAGSLEGKARLLSGIDVYSKRFEDVMAEARRSSEYMVVVAVHSCRTLPVRIMEVFKAVGGDRLMIVPCCAKPSWARKAVGVEVHGYWDWVYALWKYATQVLGLEAVVTTERAMLSDANAIIEVLGSRG